MFKNCPKKVSFNIASYGATFTFWMDKSSLKMPKMVNFGEFLKTRQIGHFSAFLKNFWPYYVNVNVARNVEWDFFFDFQTLCIGCILKSNEVIFAFILQSTLPSGFTILGAFFVILSGVLVPLETKIVECIHIDWLRKIL